MSGLARRMGYRRGGSTRILRHGIFSHETDHSQPDLLRQWTVGKTAYGGRISINRAKIVRVATRQQGPGQSASTRRARACLTIQTPVLLFLFELRFRAACRTFGSQMAAAASAPAQVADDLRALDRIIALAVAHRERLAGGLASKTTAASAVVARQQDFVGLCHLLVKGYDASRDDAKKGEHAYAPLDFQSVSGRTYGPKTSDHPTVGTPCIVCKTPLKAGDMTLLVELAPVDLHETQRAVSGRPYTATATEVHHSCVPIGKQPLIKRSEQGML